MSQGLICLSISRSADRRFEVYQLFPLIKLVQKHWSISTGHQWSLAKQKFTLSNILWFSTNQISCATPQLIYIPWKGALSALICSYRTVEIIASVAIPPRFSRDPRAWYLKQDDLRWSRAYSVLMTPQSDVNYVTVHLLLSLSLSDLINYRW